MLHTNRDIISSLEEIKTWKDKVSNLKPAREADTVFLEEKQMTPQCTVQPASHVQWGCPFFLRIELINTLFIFLVYQR